MKTKKKLSLNKFVVSKIGNRSLNVINGGNDDDPQTTGTDVTVVKSTIPCLLKTYDPNNPNP